MRYVAGIGWAGKHPVFDALNSMKAVLRNCRNEAGVFICFGARSC